MKTLNNLLTEIMPILILDNKEFEKNKPLQSKLTEELSGFMKSKINSEPELIFELIKKVPYAFFLIDIDKKEKYSYLFFKKAINALLNQDIDFLRNFKIETTYIVYLNSSFDIKYFEENKEFLTKEVLSYFVASSDRKRFHLLEQIIHLFDYNLSDREILLTLHEISENKESIFIPESIIKKYKKEINRDLFDKLKFKFFENKVNYFSSNNNNSSIYYYESFITDNDIALFMKEFSDTLNVYVYKNLLVNYEKNMSKNTFDEVSKVFLLKDLDKKNKSSYSSFKHLTECLKNKMAEFAVDLNVWAYANISQQKRIELVDKIDFEEYKGLLAFHPFPENITNERWIYALKESCFKLEKAPDFLLFGERALKQDDWFEILSYQPKVKNVHINYLFKYNRSVLSEELLERLSLLVEHPILNKAPVSIYIKQKNNMIFKNNKMKEVLKITKEKDEKKIAEKILELFSIGLGSKENIEMILKEYKGD